ncbi:ABC transporter ATP-binding protein [Allorhizocola rhizosphaerae]|uniref:ABC transporter ATP-binding protein n=1 Tax=Allorhizocola rhizosphaerae TaxID=1872709 RepID=UPI000E3E5321|nr:ABC transporter ATP-binding protein [Allorhizocola rhizosphaerae]
MVLPSLGDLVAEKVHLRYGDTVALAGASATIASGEIVAMVGPSGSGKSSLLYCLAGLIAPDSGEVRFAGTNLARLPDDERSDLRRSRFGFVFQFAELVPELTLRENIALPLELNGVKRRERVSRVDELVDRLGLADHAERRPSKVSGGQAQRAAVARAIAHRPSFLFADEPTGSLDSANGMVVLDLLLQLANDDGAAVVIVTHDERVAAQADRVIRIADGRCGQAAS